MWVMQDGTDRTQVEKKGRSQKSMKVCEDGDEDDVLCGTMGLYIEELDLDDESWIMVKLRHGQAIKLSRVFKAFLRDPHFCKQLF